MPHHVGFSHTARNTAAQLSKFEKRVVAYLCERNVTIKFLVFTVMFYVISAEFYSFPVELFCLEY